MRKWEVIYPYVFSIIIFGLFLYLKYDISDVKNFTSILGSAITLSSIVIAFLATMLSILITLTNAEVMSRINRGDGEGLLMLYLNTAIITGLLVAVYSMTLYLFTESTGLYSNILLSVFFGLISLFFLAAFRIIRLVAGILGKVLKDAKPAAKEKKVFKPTIKNNATGE